MRQIIIAERGWVYVGQTSRVDDKVVLAECSNVRRWDPEKGLGALAMHGPQSDDKCQLLRCPTVRVPILGVIAELDCNEEAWAAWAAREFSR